MRVFQIFDSTLDVKRYGALISHSHTISPIINEQQQISIYIIREVQLAALVRGM
jgi:hypothetical protein